MHNTRGFISLALLFGVLVVSGVGLARLDRSGPVDSATTALTAAADLQMVLAGPANCANCEPCVLDPDKHLDVADQNGAYAFMGHSTCVWGAGGCPHDRCGSSAQVTRETSEALAALTTRIQRGEATVDELTQGEFAPWVRVDEDGGLDILLPCNPSALLARLTTANES